MLSALYTRALPRSLGTCSTSMWHVISAAVTVTAVPSAATRAAAIASRGGVLDDWQEIAGKSPVPAPHALPHIITQLCDCKLLKVRLQS